MAAWHRLSKIPQPLLPEDPNVDRWAGAHAEFHLALIAACGSNKLLQIRSQLYQQSERYRRYSGIVDRDRNVFAEHQAIFDAAIARDTAAAAEAIDGTSANHGEDNYQLACASGRGQWKAQGGCVGREGCWVSARPRSKSKKCAYSKYL